MSDEATEAIRDMVHDETDAWNRRDASALVGLFHPDMVWPWPASNHMHDPLTWTIGMGRFNRERWRANWQRLFDENELLRNDRQILRVEVTPEGDGGFAIVDIDTRWRSLAKGTEDRWYGRTCKAYAKCDDGWKMTMQTGVLLYD